MARRVWGVFRFFSDCPAAGELVTSVALRHEDSFLEGTELNCVGDLVCLSVSSEDTTDGEDVGWVAAELLSPPPEVEELCRDLAGESDTTGKKSDPEFIVRLLLLFVLGSLLGSPARSQAFTSMSTGEDSPLDKIDLDLLVDLRSNIASSEDTDEANEESWVTPDLPSLTRYNTDGSSTSTGPS